MVRRAVPELAVNRAELAVEVTTRNPDRPSDRLRFEAKAIYTTHPDGITVEELANDPRFASVALDTLYNWSRQDGWVEERRRVLQDFGNRLKKDLQKALYSRLAQVRIKQLRTVSKVKQNLLNKLLHADVKSAEGAAKVVIDLMKHELDLSHSIGQELNPGQVSGGAIDPRNALSEAEVLDAARIILKNRRAGAGPTPALPPPPSSTPLLPANTQEKEGNE